MAVIVLGVAVIWIGWKLLARANRPADRNFVSAQWLRENVKRKE